jgi:hypothetical protein
MEPDDDYYYDSSPPTNPTEPTQHTQFLDLTNGEGGEGEMVTMNFPTIVISQAPNEVHHCRQPRG